jgi:hypothetical protein
MVGAGGKLYDRRGNIAGKCIRLFDITQVGWYSTSISNIYSESLATIGSITSQIPTSISNCTFHFVFPEVIGSRPCSIQIMIK